DALRKRSSHAARMKSDSARAAILAVLRWDWDLSVDDVAALCDPETHGPSALTDEERAALSDDQFAGPAHALANVPEWLWPSFERTFASEALAEGPALPRRAPVDWRFNTLKPPREKVLKALEQYAPAETPFAPHGVRISVPIGPKRAPAVEADTAFL